MHQNLVSIIIPVYNHAHTIEECLMSIKNQSYRPLEVVIVDDGSADNFKQLASTLARRFSEPHLEIKIVHQKNKGASAARNHGFALSQGNYVLFCDADVVMRIDMLERLYQALQVNPQAQYAYGQFKFGKKVFFSQPFSAEELRDKNYITTMSLIRRDDFPGFDESLKRFQDWDLWLTMLERGKIGMFVPEVLMEVLIRKSDSISRWLPKFVYKLPWKLPAVKRYEEARKIVVRKHKLL